MSPSGLGDHGHDDGYYDAEFEHECDAEDAALDMRERLRDNERISTHGGRVRRRMRNLLQGRGPRRLMPGSFDQWRDFSF